MILIFVLFVATGAALADTIYLRGGKEVRGTFTGYENGEFTITDNDGTLLKIRVNRVERVVIDRDTRWRGEERRSQREQWESFDAFNVSPNNAWVQSPVQVYKGQRLRVEASGIVSLDGLSTVNPEGLNGQRRRNSPMPNENVGALIARIGTNANSPLLVVGRSGEIVADRDGILYFAVNSPRTANSRGAFVVNVALNRRTGGSGDNWPGRSRGIDKTIIINGNQAWVDTGIDLGPNMAVEIVAEGQIAYSATGNAGPDGGRKLALNNYPVRNAGVGAVIAKVRYQDGHESGPMFVGASNRMSTEQNETGRLFIGVNDDNFDDNQGSYRVTIRGQ